MTTDMRALFKPDTRARGRLLAVLGAAMLAFSLLMLYRTAPLAQYMTAAPVEAGQANAQSALARILEKWDAQKTELGANAKAGLAATRYDSGIESSAGQFVNATLTCVSAGWFDAHPKFLKTGRLFGQAEWKDGAKVAVLDEELAFQLFPTVDAVGNQVRIDDAWYEVIGVVRHRRSAGDADECGAYIPIQTAAKAGMQTDYVQIDCALDIPGAARATQSVGGAVLGAGTCYDTDKEIMRASMIVRVLIILFSFYILARLLRAWNARTRSLIAGWRAEVLHRYFKKMLPQVLLYSFGQLLGYAVLIAAAYGILSLTIRPMYVFTEWIPEVIVEWTNISARAHELMAAAAAPVKYQTREYAAIRFYGAFARWGAICVLCALAVRRRRQGKPEK